MSQTAIFWRELLDKIFSLVISDGLRDDFKTNSTTWEVPLMEQSSTTRLILSGIGHTQDHFQNWTTIIFYLLTFKGWSVRCVKLPVVPHCLCGVGWFLATQKGELWEFNQCWCYGDALEFSRMMIGVLIVFNSYSILQKKFCVCCDLCHLQSNR